MTNLAEYRLGTNPTVPIGSDADRPEPGLYYFYDAVGRVIGAYKFSDSALVYGIDYEYDSLGNRTSTTVGAAN
jgi:hypothetical protein